MTTADDNLKAFLTMIAVSEGTENIGDQQGYNVLVGSTAAKPLLFSSYADHPRTYNKQMNSTAAGRYQILSRYYDDYKAQLDLPDFSPPSQDAIAVQMIKECQALADISGGYIPAAIKKCSSRWASLPGNNYGQHQNELSALVQAYTAAGGTLADDGAEV